MLLLWGRITEFLLQHISFQSILFVVVVCCLFCFCFVSEGAGAVAFWDHKMNREIGKEIYSRCTEHTEFDGASNSTLKLVSKQQGWGQTSLLHGGIHKFLIGKSSFQWLFTHLIMHTSSRMQQEVQSVIPSMTYTWTPTYVFMFFLKLCQHTWLRT